MLKTITAALLAASVFAAPTLAATQAKTPAKTAQAPAKTTQAPAAKTTSAKTTAAKPSVAKTAQAPVIKADQSKSKVMNANAKMHRHHVKHPRHHKMSVLKSHHTAKVAIKPVKPAKRG